MLSVKRGARLALGAFRGQARIGWTDGEVLGRGIIQYISMAEECFQMSLASGFTFGRDELE